MLSLSLIFFKYILVTPVQSLPRKKTRKKRVFYQCYILEYKISLKCSSLLFFVAGTSHYTTWPVIPSLLSMLLTDPTCNKTACCIPTEQLSMLQSRFISAKLTFSINGSFRMLWVWTQRRNVVSQKKALTQAVWKRKKSDLMLMRQKPGWESKGIDWDKEFELAG